jgi:release factor glutamine methyltransferase
MIGINTMEGLRSYTHEKLSRTYSTTEINALFFRTIEELLGISKSEYHTNPQIRVSESDFLKLRNAIKELKKNKPIQYILRKATFYDLDLYVDSDVLIPRSETEEMFEDIVSTIQFAPNRVLDLGTGSGCIALALKKIFPFAEVFALDSSEKALQVAQKNAKRLMLSISCVHLNIEQAASLPGKWDIIVSNPPYVTHEDKTFMASNVLDFEPELALFVPDEDPLIFYRLLARFTVENLTVKGWFFFEINEKFGEEVMQLLREYGLTRNLKLMHDLNQKPRWVKGQIH